jgi:polyadenylate-binding protein
MVDEEGNSRGYGFVHFDKDKSATDAIHDMNGLQELVVSHFIRRNVRLAAIIANFTNLYIKQVLPNIDVKTIEKLFSKYGGITSAVTRQDRRGRVFAFCNFTSQD